jgi:hypothetical protein
MESGAAAHALQNLAELLETYADCAIASWSAVPRLRDAAFSYGLDVRLRQEVG